MYHTNIYLWHSSYTVHPPRTLPKRTVKGEEFLVCPVLLHSIKPSSSTHTPLSGVCPPHSLQYTTTFTVNFPFCTLSSHHVSVLRWHHTGHILPTSCLFLLLKMNSKQQNLTAGKYTSLKVPYTQHQLYTHSIHIFITVLSPPHFRRPHAPLR